MPYHCICIHSQLHTCCCFLISRNKSSAKCSFHTKVVPRPNLRFYPFVAVHITPFTLLLLRILSFPFPFSCPIISSSFILFPLSAFLFLHSTKTKQKKEGKKKQSTINSYHKQSKLLLCCRRSGKAIPHTSILIRIPGKKKRFTKKKKKREKN